MALDSDSNSIVAVFPWVEGASLKKLLSPGASLPYPVRCRLAFAMAKAVRSLHEQGIAHLDLKPNNVMVEDPAGLNPLVRLVDFDGARLDGRLLGGRDAPAAPVDYGAPEQQSSRWSGWPDFRSDVFALGVNLVHLLTGRHPFDEGLYDEQIVAQDWRIEPHPDYPLHRQVAKTLAGCLSRDPADRPSAKVVQAKLASYRDREYCADDPAAAWGMPSAGSSRFGVRLSALGGRRLQREYFDSIDVDWRELRLEDEAPGDEVVFSLRLGQGAAALVPRRAGVLRVEDRSAEPGKVIPVREGAVMELAGTSFVISFARWEDR